jgi:hypothetical protein
LTAFLFVPPFPSALYSIFISDPVKLKTTIQVSVAPHTVLGFDVLTAVKVSTVVFWVATGYGLAVRYKLFEETYCLHLQDRNVGTHLNVHKASQPRRPPTAYVVQYVISSSSPVLVLLKAA